MKKRMKKIDIFGDGKYVFDIDKLPEEILTEDGKWKKGDRIGSIASYNLEELSQQYIKKQKQDQEVLKQQLEEEERTKKIWEKAKEMAEREIEKEEQGA